MQVKEVVLQMFDPTRTGHPIHKQRPFCGLEYVNEAANICLHCVLFKVHSLLSSSGKRQWRGIDGLRFSSPLFAGNSNGGGGAWEPRA